MTTKKTEDAVENEKKGGMGAKAAKIKPEQAKHRGRDMARIQAVARDYSVALNRLELALGMYLNGEPVGDIMRETGYAASSIRNQASAYGLVRDEPVPVKAPKNRSKPGLLPVAIARVYGKSIDEKVVPTLAELAGDEESKREALKKAKEEADRLEAEASELKRRALELRARLKELGEGGDGEGPEGSEPGRGGPGSSGPS